MASIIKIKNSTGSPANTGAPTGLAQGEMAYSFNNDTLVIGTGTSGTNIIIGGAAYAGNYVPTSSTLQNISNIFGLSSTPLVIKGTNSQVVNIGSTGVDTSILGTLSVLQTANISALAVTNGATFSGVTSFSYANGIGFKDVNDTATSGASPSYFIRPSTTDLTTATGIKTFFLPIIAGTTTTTSDSLVSATSTDTLTNKTWNGAAIGATYGGTGLTSYAIGDIPYAATANPSTLSKLAAVATGSVLLSAGTNVAPVWGQVSLTGAVTGTLPPGNGGTGVANNVASTITISGAFATTLTVGATTALTLPATGILATLAGSESFTNKTGYNGLLITANSGIITSGTWNGTVIGASYLPALVAATGSVGLTAVTGSATTAMRSDSTPALSQAIAPSWTGKHIHTTTTSATVFTAADNLIALNTGLAATAIAVSNSPYISLQTNVWNGTASAAQTFNIQNQNTTAGASTYQLAFAAGSSTVFTLSQSGNASFNAEVKAGNVLLDGISVANALTNKTGYNGLVITANTGVITSGTWNGTAIGATYGGTGVNNGSNTITLAGSLVTTGAFTTTLAAGASITLTLPTVAGILATLAGSESFTNKTGYNGLLITANSGIITSGTWNGAAIGATYGGTGLTSYAAGDIPYAATANPSTLSKLAAVATGSVLLSAGINTAPTWGKVDLTAAVTGILPLANGGTGVTLATTGPGFLRQASANATVTVSAIVAADLPGTFSGFATPATSIGLTAAAGSATTAMRSDGAPALSVAIAPTWTAQHIFSNYAPQCSVAPTGDTQLVNKLYVDTVAQGLHVHPPADVILLADLATTVTGESTFAYGTGTITITGTAMTFTVDSVLMANWTRIVIAGESSTTASTSAPNKEWHGIYTKSTSTTTSIVLTRAVDADNVSDLNGGDFIFIQSGTIYADTGFVQTVSSALGAIAFASANGFYPTFVQFSQAGVIAAGNGLEKSGVALAVKALDSSITVASGGISVGTIDGGSF